MKKSVFSAALAVILLAGCAPSENSENLQSSSGAQSSSSSTKTSSSSASLSSSKASGSSSAAQSTESSQSSSGAESSSSSKPAQSSSKASSSKPAQSSSQKPASSSSKPASSSATESKPAVSTGKLAPENNPLPDYKYIEDPDAKGAIVYGIRTNDPKQGTYTPDDVSGYNIDENGFPYGEWFRKRSSFVDKNGVKWEYAGGIGWFISGTDPGNHEAAPGFGGGQIPGAY